MMKTSLNAFVILLLAGMLLSSGCSKTANTNTGGSGGSTGLLKTMIQVVATANGTDSTITNLTYDNQNRVVLQVARTVINGNTLGNDSTTYTFGTNSVIQYSSATQTSVTYSLNSQGFKQSDNLGDSWAYNSAGYLTQGVQASSGATTTYTYNSANELTQETAVSASGTKTYSFTYAGNPIGHAGSSWSQGQSTGDLFATEIENVGGVETTLTANYLTNGQGQLTQSTISSNAANSYPVVTFYIYYQ